MTNTLFRAIFKFVTTTKSFFFHNFLFTCLHILFHQKFANTRNHNRIDRIQEGWDISHSRKHFQEYDIHRHLYTHHHWPENIPDDIHMSNCHRCFDIANYYRKYFVVLTHDIRPRLGKEMFFKTEANQIKKKSWRERDIPRQTFAIFLKPSRQEQL